MTKAIASRAIHTRLNLLECVVTFTAFLNLLVNSYIIFSSFSSWFVSMSNCCVTSSRVKLNTLREKLTQLCLQTPILEYCFVVTETGLILSVVAFELRNILILCRRPSSRIRPLAEVEPQTIFQMKQLATQLSKSFLGCFLKVMWLDSFSCVLYVLQNNHTSNKSK